MILYDLSSVLNWSSLKCLTLLKLANIWKNVGQMLAKCISSRLCRLVPYVRQIFVDNFLKQNFKFGAVLKCRHLVDLERCFKVSVYLQNSASVQPRTSSPKCAITDLPIPTSRDTNILYASVLIYRPGKLSGWWLRRLAVPRAPQLAQARCTARGQELRDLKQGLRSRQGIQSK